MELHRVNFLMAIVLALRLQVKGQISSSPCTILNSLIANNINANELSCERLQGCSGLHCFNQNSLLRNFAEVFNVRLQPCATPSPAVWLEVLGEVDPTNNRRSVAFNESVNNTRVVAYPIEGGGDILFGTYNFTVNISEDNSNVGIAVQLTRNTATVWVVNYTVIPFSSAGCLQQTTTATPPGTTATQFPPASDDPRTTNDSNATAPPGVNTDPFPMGTASGTQVIPQVVLNISLVLLTMLAIATLVV